MKKNSRFDVFIYLLIIANIIAMILESHQFIKKRFGEIFNIFELISILIFTLEYFYRIFLSYRKAKWSGIKSYIFSFFGIIDFISILPFYIKQFVLIDGRFFRILRLFRLTRIFKLGRESKSLKLFIKAISAVQNELKLLFFYHYCVFFFQHQQYIFLKMKHNQRCFQV